MNTHLEILVKELTKNDVSAKCCEIITDNEGNVSASEPFRDFSEHDKKVAEEKDAQIRELKRQIEDLESIITDGKKPDISVSENGVSVGCECGGYHLAKERIAVLEKKNKDLESCFTQREQDSTDMIIKLKQRIAELESKETEACENEPISDDCRPSTEWYEDRHQSDCIRINQLLTTIDVLTERYQKLREVHGL